MTFITGPSRTPETNSSASAMQPEDHRRAHVGLGQDQDAGEAGDDEERSDDAAVGGVLDRGGG